MRCIAIANAKGGVGKSCLAAHLAVAYANSNYRTLLIDMDKQGHATQRVGVDPHPEAPCIGDVLIPPYSTTLESIIVRDVRSNLDVAAGLPRMKHLEPMLYADPLRYQKLRAALQDLGEPHEIVVIDTSPNIGPYTENALFAADLIIAPLAPHAGADQGYDDLAAHVDNLKQGQPYELRGAVNLLDRRTRATNAALSEQRNEMGVHRFATEITRAEAVNQANLANMLIFDTEPTHPHAGLFTELAQEAFDLVEVA